MLLNTYGIGRRQRGSKGLNLAAIPDCEFWIDCARRDSVNFISGNSVSQVNDLSGNGRDLTKTGAGNETIYPVYNDDEQGIQFLNTAFDQMKTGNTGDWNFMHDGSGCTILLMLKINTDYAANGALFSTSSAGTSGIGTNLWFYNDTQRYRVETRNGASLAFSSYGSANSLQKDRTKIVSIHSELRSGILNDIVTRSNGATDFQGNALSSLSTANSSGTLFFGKLTTGGVFAPQYILKKCAIFSRRLTKREENTILNDWAKQETVPLTQYGQRDFAVLSGQSNAKGHGLIIESAFNTDRAVANALIFDLGSLSFPTLEAGVNNYALSANNLGLEMNFSKTYTNNTGRELSFVKNAVDGTAITQWLPGTPNFDALKNEITSAIYKIEDDGYVINPIAFIWYQGESDAFSAANYNAYETNLKTFIDGLNTIPQFAQTPFMIVEIQQDPYKAGTSTVQNAGITVCNTSPYSAYTRYIQTDDISTNIDANHVDAVSLDAIGARITQTLLS